MESSYASPTPNPLHHHATQLDAHQVNCGSVNVVNNSPRVVTLEVEPRPASPTPDHDTQFDASYVVLFTLTITITKNPVNEILKLNSYR